MIIEREPLFYSEKLRDAVFLVFASGQNLSFANDVGANAWLRNYKMLDASYQPDPLCYRVRVKLTDAYREARHNRRLAIQSGQSVVEVTDREKRRKLAHQLADAAHVKSYQARRARDMD